MKENLIKSRKKKKPKKTIVQELIGIIKLKKGKSPRDVIVEYLLEKYK